MGVIILRKSKNPIFILRSSILVKNKKKVNDQNVKPFHREWMTLLRSTRRVDHHCRDRPISTVGRVPRPCFADESSIIIVHLSLGRDEEQLTTIDKELLV